jgi:hypothetical protein
MARPVVADGGDGIQIWRVKIKLSLCLTKHNAAKVYGEWRYSSTHS